MVTSKGGRCLALGGREALVCVRFRGRAAAAAARGAGRGAGFSSVLFCSILFRYAASFVSVEATWTLMGSDRQ